MIEAAVSLIVFVAKVTWLVAQRLIWPALAYAALALAMKGRGALDGARRAASQTRTTLGLYVLDFFLVGPPLALGIALITSTVHRYGLAAVPPAAWSAAGLPVTFLLTLFIGDFTAYWRHRLEHTRWLWPAHAIHHSDEEMTWLTGNRFHPVNNLTTAVIDNTVLALLGFPAWAITLNELVRHYYGEFIHADVPWTYGIFGRFFVSPAMHRWHHARDVTGSGSNFATVFSVFDQAFGTHYVPGPCTVALGVNDPIGRGPLKHLQYPFKRWMRALARSSQRKRRADDTAIAPTLNSSGSEALR
jgi:sterol desaturase/sphingolipid hydroxylase (fatty acid hydroxylase superfamily)